MVKQTPQEIRRQQPANCLSVFDHFAGLAIKRTKLGNDKSIPKKRVQSSFPF